MTAALSLLSTFSPFRMVEARVFDLLATAQPPAMADLAAEPGSVVIVAIDEPSFAEIGLRWPWPRSLHAELAEALRSAGARAIGFDIVFSEPSVEVEDAALAAAMGPDVVLAADATLLETPQATLAVRSEPLPDLLAAGASSGLASVTLDADGVLRRLPPWPDAFAPAVLAAAGEEAPPSTGFVRPMGPSRTYPTVSYYQALDPEAFLPPDVFRDRIVLVGMSLQAAAELDSGGADRFATPFTARTGQLVAGVEVQAAILDTLRHGLVIQELSGMARAGLILAAALLAGLVAAWRSTDLWSYAAGMGLVLLAFGASAVAMGGLAVFLPPIAPGLAILGVLTPVAVHDHARERRMRRQITRAFGQYLSPQMVERLSRNPGQLRLGGERRELSILFSDVRNFTPLAERMRGEPEALTQIVNRILTPLSDAVLANGGTIDKYIGDCIMAFWNAPLDDPDHAVHAVEAGLAMLAGIERLNAELAEEAAPGDVPPRLAIGVGINTGTCIVGNMGSDKRFDYSALGDAVNYASRLEGASKECGVPLLIGASTAAAVKARFDAVLVDRIGVKGRSETAAVYTVLSPERLLAPDLARHTDIAQRLIAGEAVDPLESAELAQRQPALAPIHERLRARLTLRAGGGQGGVVPEALVGESIEAHL